MGISFGTKASPVTRIGIVELQVEVGIRLQLLKPSLLRAAGKVHQAPKGMAPNFFDSSDGI